MKSNSLPKHLIDPFIVDKVWSTYMRGDYDTAVFLSFKEVEIVVRSAAGFSATDIGVPMMRRAFHPGTGPLADTTTPNGEQEALQALFAGAVGSYKNPHSHRTVTLNDPQDAAEMIILASHL